MINTDICTYNMCIFYNHYMDKWSDRNGQRKVVLVWDVDVVCKTIKYKYFDDCNQKNKFNKKLEEPELDYL